MLKHSFRQMVAGEDLKAGDLVVERDTEAGKRAFKAWLTSVVDIKRVERTKFTPSTWH